MKHLFVMTLLFFSYRFIKNVLTKKITNTINGPTGAINNFMREGSRQINKASRVIEASKLL